MPEKPGYLSRTEQLDKAGVVPSPATGTDVFSVEPGTPSLPVLNPRCEPRPLNVNTLTRITTAGVEIPLAQLQVPNGATYDAFEIQWWVDYPLLVELGFIQVYFKYGAGDEQDVYVPFPTIYPTRFCREFTRGEQINVFARLSPGFPVSGALGTPIYVGCSAQLGYQRSQFPTLATKGKDVTPQGFKRAAVVVASGAALFNPFVAVSLVASRVRVWWPIPTPGAPFAGAIAITSSADAGGPQAGVVYIDQGFGVNIQGNNSVELPLGDVRELWVGNPPPATPLVLPRTIIVEWDQWRAR